MQSENLIGRCMRHHHEVGVQQLYQMLMPINNWAADLSL
jgi:hypothetical protein